MFLHVNRNKQSSWYSSYHPIKHLNLWADDATVLPHQLHQHDPIRRHGVQQKASSLRRLRCFQVCARSRHYYSWYNTHIVLMPAVEGFLPLCSICVAGERMKIHMEMIKSRASQTPKVMLLVIHKNHLLPLRLNTRAVRGLNVSTAPSRGFTSLVQHCKVQTVILENTPSV